MDNDWETSYEEFKEIVGRKFTVEQLYEFKNFLDIKIAEYEETKHIEDLAKGFMQLSQESREKLLGLVGKADSPSTIDGTRKSRRPLSGFVDYQDGDGKKYKIAKYINLQQKKWFAAGNPKFIYWLQAFSKAERDAKYGALTLLESDANLLKKFAAIGGAVTIENANGEFVAYSG